MNELVERFQCFGIIPVVVLESIEHALPVADALAEGGLPVIEVTMRTEVALEAIHQIATKRPHMLVGAGTVLKPADVRRCLDAGAQFGLAPGLNQAVVREAQSHRFPFVPGVMTPSEIEQALSLGCSCLKFFPAQSIGGANCLKTMVAPYLHCGVRLIPTGGIGQDSLKDYLELDFVAAVGGGFMTTRADLQQHSWSQITDRAGSAMQVVNSIRSGLPSQSGKGATL